MSHITIVILLIEDPRTKPEQKAKLQEITARHEFNRRDRAYIAWMAYKLSAH